ncbi:MAG: ribonuclease III [Candidatus Pacebacteria bacterium]|nr:ribonuclease III [Candidatus Paceibacterota bacterium]
MEKKISSLEKILGVHFKDKELLNHSLTHRSYLNEHPECSWENNERLEFLGDAVLEFVVSDYLYKKFEKPEGEMTGMRAAIVRTETLSDIAKDIGIEEFLYLSKGEKNDKGKARKYILANTLEAIIGAIFIDQGTVKAKDFIENKILSRVSDILSEKDIKDPKSKFQELAQEKFNITPIYKVIREWGPEHKKNFLIGVYLKNKLIGEGEGSSKQEAEEAAARKAFKEIISNKF